MMGPPSAHPNADLIEAFLKALGAARGAVKEERDARVRAGSAQKRAHTLRCKPTLPPKIDPAGLFGADRWHALDPEAQSVITTRLMEGAAGFAAYKTFTDALEAADSAEASTAARLDATLAVVRTAIAAYISTRAMLLAALGKEMSLPAGLPDSTPLTALELLALRPDPVQTFVDPLTISTAIDASGNVRGEPKVVVRVSGRGPGLNRCPHCGAPAQTKCGCRKKAQRH